MTYTTITTLVITAAWLGIFYTFTGPDHYLPFVFISREKNWKLRKTMVFTFLCGLGHVLSSVLIGLVGIAIGVAVNRMENIEGVRGDIAAWLLTIFGVVYGTWGLYKALTGKPTHTHHKHKVDHALGHEHIHGNDEEIKEVKSSQKRSEKPNEHRHDNVKTKDEIENLEESGKPSSAFWSLFIIFVFGPCEPLIPLIMVPASEFNWGAVVFVAGIFAIATIGVMLLMVLFLSFGVLKKNIEKMGMVKK